MHLDLSDLVEGLGKKVLLVQADAAAEGILIAKTSGRRGFARQAVLYTAFQRSPQEAREKHGVVAKPAPMGLTRHHGYFAGKAAAVDLGIINAKDADDKRRKQARLVAIARGHGLICGADWGDPVHFELAIDGKRMDVAAEYIRLGEKLDRIAGNIITVTPPLPGGGA